MKKIITSILIAATIVSLSATNVLAAEDLLINDINIIDEGLDVATEDSSLISDDDFEESLDYVSEYDIIEDYSDNISIDTLSLSELGSNDISEEYSEDIVADTASENIIFDQDEEINLDMEASLSSNIILETTYGDKYYYYTPYEDSPYDLIYLIKDNYIDICGYIIDKEKAYNTVIDAFGNEHKFIKEADIIIPDEIYGITVEKISTFKCEFYRYTDDFGMHVRSRSALFPFKVKNIILPSTIKELQRESIYADYRGDNDIIIPEGVEIIWNEALMLSNEEVRSNAEIILPSTLKEIGDRAFYNTLNFEGNKDYYYEYTNSPKLHELIIPEGVKKIGNEAFFGINGYKNITIPSTVREIGTDAFAYVGIEKLMQLQDYILKGGSKNSIKAEYENYYVESITNNSIVPIPLPGLPGSPYGLTWTDKETGESIMSVSNGQTAILSDSDYVHEIQEREVVASQTINLDAIFDEEGYCYTIDDGIYAKRYTVDNKKLASISKNKLKANKIGTVKVTEEIKWEKTDNFEPVCACEIIILPKPALKFNKPLTYEGQSIDGFEYAASSYYDLRQYNIIYWRSSNSKVAEVDEDGIIIAKGQGTTTISAYIEDEGITNKIVIFAKLTIKYPKFNKPSYTYKTGDKIVLAMKNVNASLKPEFEASGENINVYPQLDKKGNPTGKVVIETLSCGDATLTAIIDDQEYTCDIHVTAPKINKNKLTLRKNKYASLSLSNTKIKKQNVVWESENDSIATIDEKGRIKGISEGEVIIFTNTGGIRNECVVTVK